MPLINLIQEQRLSRQREERRGRLFFMGFVGTAIASAGAFGFLFLQTDAARGEVAKLEAQAQRLAPLLAQMEENNKQFGQLSPRLKTLVDAQDLTSRWDRILKHLAVQTPSKTWLTGIRCSAQDPTKPVQVSFIGMAANQDLVGDFILRLQNCTDLESVNLKYTQEKVVAEGIGIEYEVAGDLAGTAQAKPLNEEKKEGQQ
jgi:Tfp pilus assembly protein PilN